jgi:transposase
VLGVSGRLMLDALVSGTTDPGVLADLARGLLRKKLPALKEALTGNFRPHHALIVSHILAHLDYLDETIEQISLEVERRLAPFARETELLATIDGVAVRNAQVILAELGPDMSRFPSDRTRLAGPRSAQATTSRPASARPVVLARATSICAPR